MTQTNAARVLIVDDNPGVRAALSMLCAVNGWSSVELEGPDAALAWLKSAHSQSLALVLQDMNFQRDTGSGEEGIALFHQIRAMLPDVPIILLTAWTHLEHAVALARAGAADYLPKPWDDQKLTASMRNLLELGEANLALRQLKLRDAQQKQALAERFDLRGLIVADAAMLRVVELACQVARSDLPVLISGPNGAGKEKISEIIQANSLVRDKPFVTLNCGAIPGELIEAELFGAEAGAYTGIKQARAGKFEAADGGTLLLDEIGNLPLAGQMKLLRVLETGRFQRLGSNHEKRVQVRVLSASNADLPSMIRAGQFREDLYYRLNCITIALPALAARPQDIPALAAHFLAGSAKALSAEALDVLMRHAWPGNVRELKNTLLRAALLAPEPTIRVADLGLSSFSPTPQQAPREPTPVEIDAALARANGVVAQAAAELGLSRQALYRRMERIGRKRDEADSKPH
jgi:DNA-binding NtrC family response regulator